MQQKTKEKIDKQEVDKWNIYDDKAIGTGGYTSMVLMRKYVEGRILEFGCGRGKLLGGLKNVTEKYGVDLSERAIEYARENVKDGKFIVADVCNTPFPDRYFDFVYSIEVIEHIPDAASMLSEMHRVLKPGGYAYIQTPNYPIKRCYDFLHWMRGKRKELKDDYTHVSKFSFRKLRNLCKSLFIVVEIRSRNLFGEKYFSFINETKERGSLFSLIVGQKTIIVLKKT